MPESYVPKDAVIAGIDPDWSGVGKVHDWRNHVPEGVQAIWSTFTEQQRRALYEWADDLAMREDWD